MLTRLCPICGKNVEKYYENVCKDCFVEKRKKEINIDTNLKIKNCVICKKFYYENDEEALQTIEFALKKFLEKVKRKYPNSSIIIENGKFYCEASEIVNKIKISKKFELNLEVKKIRCKNCLKSIYFKPKAILQIRSVYWKDIQNIIENFSRSLENEYLLFSEFYFNGFDVQFSSEKIAIEISNNLIKEFSLKRKLTKKLLGMKKGKKIFQTTILLKDA